MAHPANMNTQFVMQDVVIEFILVNIVHTHMTLTVATDDRVQLVADTIAFMQSLVRHYGDHKGMETFERLADHIDPDLKSEVFIAMLTGQFNGRVTLHSIADGANPVACIKAIRSVDNRRLGLKEAKDMYDGLKYSGKPATLEIPADRRRTAAAELRAAGFEL